jgi:hypothetical protein
MELECLLLGSQVSQDLSLVVETPGLSTRSMTKIDYLGFLCSWVLYISLGVVQSAFGATDGTCMVCAFLLANERDCFVDCLQSLRTKSMPPF